MERKEGKCQVCGSTAIENREATLSRSLYECDNCGNYFIYDQYKISNTDKNYFASYLYYTNKLFSQNNEHNNDCYLCSQENYKKMRESNPLARIVTSDVVINWYPSSFNEIIDTILLGLAKLSSYIGIDISLPHEQMKSMFFVKYYLLDKETSLSDQIKQIDTLADYMSEQKFIKKESNKITVLPDGWKRIDVIQKNQSSSKQVFIAMHFSDTTLGIREAIRQGVEKSGYTPFFIDEKEHNNQIVPEILYEIRKSKFIIAELSDHNNGAYYEAGYAEGLGKEVIIICNNEEFTKDSHFDVKQKSAVLWKKEDEIPDLLYKRIMATIK